MPAPDVVVLNRDSRRIPEVPSDSIALVVTSPPYPMIPQWDALFSRLGAENFGSMHGLLESVWQECYRTLLPGGLLAINIGDALRSRADDGFRLWPNHAEVLRRCAGIGFRPLPYVLWKKPMNRPNAFLGSGFLPPNAYVTVDCEFILLFRKGGLRRFPRKDASRRQSVYRKEERDRWFSQVWEVRASRQDGEAGRRTAAFPPEIPRRLIRMFSVEGDTVLDPFAGTGTTLRVARELRRRAVGVEIETELAERLRREFTAPEPNGDAGGVRPRRTGSAG
ncbi:MAG TPA: site-specific DNA-methyltransferase [Thermoplasmata archaeon]|nr:site-specific DNA-methyltransferase [Thermoplasmata archaeon]